jgi:hypothetical protein
MKDIIKLEKIYETIMNPISLASKVQDTLSWLLPIEDFEEAEDSCNAELDYVGQGRESIVYSNNGVIIKINDGDKSIWEPYIQLKCFAKTELYDAGFGFVILQEELKLDSSEYWEQDVEQKIINCLDESGLRYSTSEITDENVGVDINDEWKLFDIPLQ